MLIGIPKEVKDHEFRVSVTPAGIHEYVARGHVALVERGAGAGARHSVGTGVMGGMLAATFLAIFFVPTFFKLMTDRHLTEKRSTAAIKREAESARNVVHKPVPTAHHAPHRHE